jgi:hypothetical protein
MVFNNERACQQGQALADGVVSGAPLYVGQSIIATVFLVL